MDEIDYEKTLILVYVAAQRRDPCDLCGTRGNFHHATCEPVPRNLCHACYEKEDRPVTQLYQGDKGYSPFGNV